MRRHRDRLRSAPSGCAACTRRGDMMVFDGGTPDTTMAGDSNWDGTALMQRTLGSCEDKDNDNRYGTPMGNLRKCFTEHVSGRDQGVRSYWPHHLKIATRRDRDHVAVEGVGAARLHLVPTVDAREENEVLGRRMESHGARDHQRVTTRSSWSSRAPPASLRERARAHAPCLRRWA